MIIHILGFVFDTPILLMGLLTVFMQLLFAMFDGMGSVAQANREGTGGIALSAHGAFGSSIVLVPLLAHIIALYGDQWSNADQLSAFLGGGTGSALMYMAYLRMNANDAYVRAGRIRVAGWLNMLFMAATFATLGLYYLNTTAANPRLMWFVTIVVTVVVLMNNHYVLELTKPYWYTPKKRADHRFALAQVVGTALVSGCITYVKVGMPL